MKKNAKTSFEDSYKRLEEIVTLLDTGNLPLEETLALFEEGIRLARLCEEQLDQAELKISQLEVERSEAPQEPESRLL
jgi:exodeoxyribonuclease VII small subunit